MPWKELVKVALLGTDRARLSADSLKALHAQGISPDAPDEVKVLAGAAIYSRLRKAGHPLGSYEGEILPPDTGQLNSCADESTAHLQRILAEEEWRGRLLPEWVLHLTKADLHVPPELLPELLQLATEDAGLFALLRPAFGSRAQWLARLNPAWASLFEVADEESWDTAGHQQRLIMFKHRHQEDSLKALEMLQHSWTTESYQHKLDFLAVLSESLTAHDESFLEAALDDRRKEVRQLAAEILARLPDAAFAERMYQRAQQYLKLKSRSSKAPKLTVLLPEDCDEAMLRDGIKPGKQWSSGGLKASRLLQILSALPPARWSELLQAGAREGVEILVRSEWSELLMEGVIHATALHKDKEWAAHLLRCWIHHHDKARWQHLNVYPLFACLDDELFNELALLSLQESPQEVSEDIPATFLLKLPGFQWSDKLMFLAVKKLQLWLSNERSRYWNRWPYEGILENGAYSCAPQLFDYFYHKWPRRDTAWMKLEEELESFFTILRFRKEMIEALVNFSAD